MSLRGLSATSTQNHRAATPQPQGSITAETQSQVPPASWSRRGVSRIGFIQFQLVEINSLLKKPLTVLYLLAHTLTSFILREWRCGTRKHG